MKNLWALILFFIATSQIQAQWDCDCDFDWGEEWICVVDESGFVYSLPNECFAECLGATITDEDCSIWDDDENENEGSAWIWGCDCEIDWNEEWICITDDSGEIYSVPNECYADCLGANIVDEDCIGLWDCFCPIDWNEEWICVTDDSGEIYSVPNECYADCLGASIIDEDCIGLWDCFCPIDWNEEWICVTDDSGEIYSVPNECYADCIGASIVDEDCSIWDEEGSTGGEWEGEEFSFDCLGDIEEYTTLQNFIIGLSENCDFDLPLCLIDTPLFTTDEEYLSYIFENCEDGFGVLTDDSEGESLMEIIIRMFGETTTSTEIVVSDNFTMDIIGNPVNDILNINLHYSKNSIAYLQIINLAGQVIHKEKNHINSGPNHLKINTSNLSSGMYLLHIHNTESASIEKFIKD